MHAEKQHAPIDVFKSEVGEWAWKCGWMILKTGGWMILKIYRFKW